MIKYEVIAKGTATKGYYLTVEKYFNGKQIESYNFDSALSDLVLMSKERYKDLLWIKFNCIFDKNKESYFKCKPDCEAAAEWLQNKLNRGEEHMSKQGLVLKEEKKRLTFEDLEPGELFTSGNGIIKRKLTENGLLSETGYVGSGFFVLESGEDVGNIYLINKSDSVKRVELVNNECIYV